MLFYSVSEKSLLNFIQFIQERKDPKTFKQSLCAVRLLGLIVAAQGKDEVVFETFF